MDKEGYSKIIRGVCDYFQIDRPDETIVKNVIAFVKGKNLNYLKQQYKTNDELCDALSMFYIEHINEDDSHIKTLTPNIDPITDNFYKNNEHSVNILIDSRNRNLSNYTYGTSVNEFHFNLVPKSNTSINQGSIQVNNDLVNITSFEISNRIILPYKQSLSELNYSQEITLSFINLTANSINSSDGFFHFKFHYETSSFNEDVIIMEPSTCALRYEFNPPLRSLDDLSIRFNDPYYPINFYADRLNVSSVNYVNSDGRFNFDSPHNLSTGDVIVINNFHTLNDSKYNTLLNQIGNKKGVKITVIDDHIISTGINFNNFGSDADSNMKPDILVYSNTFRFPLTINYISNN